MRKIRKKWQRYNAISVYSAETIEMFSWCLKPSLSMKILSINNFTTKLLSIF